MIPTTPNARLIAAAPEMLAALQLALACLPNNDECSGWDYNAIAKICETAIAKAEGSNTR